MRNDLSGDWLRAIRPDDEHALPEATPYDEDAHKSDLAQGELGAIEVDEEAQDWDDLEEDGVAPRVAKDVYSRPRHNQLKNIMPHIFQRSHGAQHA